VAEALTSVGIQVDFIGSDDLSVPELLNNPRVNFLNLRGDQSHDVNWAEKIVRVLRYYVRLTVYAATGKPKLFHILWNNKFQLLDCTLLMLYYRLLGKKVVFTAHNVNAGKRDSNDSWLNRALLRIQYNLCDHIFVHTDGMKREMASEFRIPESKISVIPFGINKTVPDTSLSSAEAKRRLGIRNNDKALLFFGNIAPYKGLEYLITALRELLNRDRTYRLPGGWKAERPGELLESGSTQHYNQQQSRTMSLRRLNMSRTRKPNCTSRRRTFSSCPMVTSSKVVSFFWDIASVYLRLLRMWAV